ncbi:MAG: class D beta-lactamase [bacterium]|nr:class D beta-lactamase [bacterium]
MGENESVRARSRRSRIFLAIMVLVVGMTAGCSTAETWVHRSDFEEHFDNAGVEGVFLVYEPTENRYLTNDRARAHAAFLPASTYKIFNSLVALETGCIEDADTVIEWDGVDRGWSEWNRDQTLRSAIRCSCVWFYQELARRIGERRMQRWVAAAGYGNADISGGIDVFWLEGGLRITPYQQIGILRRLYRGELPFSQRAMDLVREIMLFERGDGYTLRAKTGWAQSTTPQVGWFVGFVEGPGEQPTFFAINIDIRDRSDERARIVITRSILGELGLMPIAERDPGALSR